MYFRMHRVDAALPWTAFFPRAKTEHKQAQLVMLRAET